MSKIYLIDYFSTNKRSFYHSCTTFSKLLFFSSVLISILLTHSVPFLLLTIAILSILIKLSNLPLRFLWKWSLYGTFFAVLFAISQLHHGLHTPLLTILKAFSSALSTLLLFSTTPYPKIFSFFNKISTLLGSSLFLTYRFFFLLLSDFENRINMLRVRGLYQGGKMNAIKNLSRLIGQIFVNSIDVSEKFYKSLLVRGFTGKFYCSEKEIFSKNDLIVLLLALVIFINMVVV